MYRYGDMSKTTSFIREFLQALPGLFPCNFGAGPGDEAMSTPPSGLARATSIFLSMILLAASELSKLPKCVSGGGGGRRRG